MFFHSSNSHKSDFRACLNSQTSRVIPRYLQHHGKQFGLLASTLCFLAVPLAPASLFASRILIGLGKHISVHYTAIHFRGFGLLDMFQYTALNPVKNEIRLIYPRKSPSKITQSGLKDETFTKDEGFIPDIAQEFELQTVSPDVKPPYTALSYMWGDNLAENMQLSVNGSDVLVGSVLKRRLSIFNTAT